MTKNENQNKEEKSVFSDLVVRINYGVGHGSFNHEESTNFEIPGGIINHYDLRNTDSLLCRVFDVWKIKGRDISPQERKEINQDTLIDYCCYYSCSFHNAFYAQNELNEYDFARIIIKEIIRNPKREDD